MARDTSNNELVAIKKIGLVDGKYCSQALRKLQVHREVTRIRHPFIVKLKGVMRPVDIDQFNDIYIVVEISRLEEVDLPINQQENNFSQIFYQPGSRQNLVDI